MKKIAFQLFLCFLVVYSANAQIKTPPASPLAKISQEVGLTTVSVDYSRPSSKGRKIFGELVPYNEIWRTGANASTKITFGEDVMIGQNKVPKGTYALYTIPGEKTWTIIFHKNTTYWGTGGKDYKVEEDQARIDVPVQYVSALVETFTIDITNLKNNGADIILSWENVRVLVPFVLDTDTKVMNDIKNQINGPSASTYYQAARYYFDEKKDLSQALVWVNMALEKGGEKFWMVRQKALILGELGRYKEAIDAAQRSTELAKAEDNMDYQRMNAKNIAEWQTKL